MPRRENAREAVVESLDRTSLTTLLARAALLLESLQDECLEPLELSFIEYSVLRVLDNAPPPRRMSPSRLAEMVVRTTGGMTKIVDRLERRGYVERIPDPDDRRSVLVGLTVAGRRASREASDAYTVGRARVLAAMTDDEIETIDAGLARLVEVFEDDRRRNT